MKKFLFCMIGTMMSLLCCGTKAPEGQLVLLEYTKSGTMAGYEYFGRVEKQPNGTFVVIAMKESYGDLYQKKIGKEELEKLKQIIVEEKMMFLFYVPFFVSFFISIGTISVSFVFH